MAVFAGFLRAVNVGGTGKLKMEDLRALCGEVGFTDISTYIASGNIVFRADMEQSAAQAVLETRLAEFTGNPASVDLRTPDELQAIVSNSPFQDAPGNKVIVLLTPSQISANFAETARHQTNEVISPGNRLVYIHYPDGQGRSKLTLPEMKTGTARNMNTISKMLSLAQGV